MDDRVEETIAGQESTAEHSTFQNDLPLNYSLLDAFPQVLVTYLKISWVGLLRLLFYHK